MRRLLLFTTNHPFTFNGGETMFVAPELPHLARAFGSVQIVPLHDAGDSLPLPPGVTVDGSLAAHWSSQRWRHYLGAPGWPGFWRELWRGAREGGWIGAVRVWRWAASARATWDWMHGALQPTQPVLLYTYWRGGQTLAAARWTTAHIGCAALTRVHRYELYDEAFSPPFQPWTSVYAQLARVVPISQHGLDYLKERGVGVSRLRLARLGVAAAVRRTPASTDGVLRVVSCSNVTSVKRVALCAQALVALARCHPQRNFTWTHFGAGPDLVAVQAVLQAAPPNLTATLAGRVPNDVVLAHYAAQPVDLFVLLSASEGLPVAIQEALAAGIPVLATDVGGVAEAVNASGDNGALLPVDSTPQAIVAALESLLLDTDLARSTARRDAAWQCWTRDFNADRNHAVFAQALAALLDD